MYERRIGCIIMDIMAIILFIMTIIVFIGHQIEISKAAKFEELTKQLEFVDVPAILNCSKGGG